MREDIGTIGVVGAGTMGAGIAQLCIQKGLNVILIDNNPKQLFGGLRKIAENLKKLEKKGKINQVERNLAFNMVSWSDDLKRLNNADIVIEAIFENKKVKQELFQKLDEICRPEAILASNTSTIPISQIAKLVKKKDRVIGMHFMNPVFVMPLVEVIKAKKTSENTFRICQDLCKRLEKTPVEARKDSPGFIANRVLFPSINEAVFTLSEDLGDAETIDKMMEMGGPYKMGPLKVADLIGLDVCLNILEILHQEFKTSKYKPCFLWKEYIEKGWLGRKTGRGFYKYE